MGSKGSTFERMVSRELSLWWSNGTDDDLFWRVRGSGGRATTRGKKGKSTRGQHGDIMATDSKSMALTKLFVIELKKGYKGASIADMMDMPDRWTNRRVWDKWMKQVLRSYRMAGTPYWMLISRRDARRILVHVPACFLDDLRKYSLFSPGKDWNTTATVRWGSRNHRHVIWVWRLEDFFQRVPASSIRKLMRIRIRRERQS